MSLFKVGKLVVRQFVWNVTDSNSYLIMDGLKALLIDAVDSQDLYNALECVEELKIIITHCHFDHICGLNKIREMIPKTVVYATSLCSLNSGNKCKNMSSTANAFMAFYNNEKEEKIDKINIIEPFSCKPADVVFDEEMVFQWEGHKIVLLQCYGHSGDSLIVIIDGKYMFSGDTILNIPTVTRFPGGSTVRFWEEDIPKMKDRNIKLVFPGHGAPGKLEDMITANKKPKRYRKR